jgi:hypothetical protein
MGPDKTYQLYRHNENGRYITARHLGRHVEIFPESGFGPRRVSVALEPAKAGKMLQSYTFTGVSLPYSNVFLPGTLLVRPAGGFFLSTENDGKSDCCSGINSDGGNTSVQSFSLTELFDETASGKLVYAAAENNAGDAEVEFGRFHGIGTCFLTFFKGDYHDTTVIHPENGWCSRPVQVETPALKVAVGSGALKPLPGPLFKIAGPGQLPPILTKYKTFEELETGKTVQISKISKYEHSVDATGGIGYDTLMTMVCTRQLVPYIGIHF